MGRGVFPPTPKPKPQRGQMGEEAAVCEYSLGIDGDGDDGVSHPCPSPPLKRPFHPSSSSSSQPLLRRCSSHTPIPGPAGTVQSAIIRRRNHHSPMQDHHPITTQEYITRAVEDNGLGFDDDFHRHPWLSAVDFVRSRGLVDGDGAIGLPLVAIKNRLGNIDKVSQVVAIVKSCTPNGLGDAMATLKDPTGTINASIHHRIFTDGEYGKEISLGSALILQKVAVFSPVRSVQYLNVTLNNVVKVIPKDGNTQTTNNAVLIEDATLTSMKKGSCEMEKMLQNSSSLSEGRIEGLVQSLRHNVTPRQITQSNEVNPGPVESSDHVGESSKNQHSAVEFDKLLPGLHDADVTAEMPVVTGRGMGSDVGEAGICEQQNTISKAGGCGPSRFKHAGVAPGITDATINQRNIAADRSNEQPSSSTVKPSLPQWTDEQLDQLFAFD